MNAGGWYAVEKAAVQKLAKANFARLQPSLPKFDVVKVGGWATVESLAADPKGALMDVIKGNLSKDYLGGIVALLQAEGKGFDSATVDGEWTLALQQSGKKSPKFQKLFSRKMATSNFDVKTLTFSGITKFFFGLLGLQTTVAFKPVADAYEYVNKKLVLRRIACDIIKVMLKLPFVSIPLGLKKKGGYLDFLYLDNDVRVTKGNKGGLFVHLRPGYVL